MFLRLLLLTSLSILVSADPIHIKIVLHCNTGKWWQATTTAIELDVFESTNDKLAIFYRAGYNSTQTINMKNIYPLSDYSFDYEITYQVEHSCTTDGSTVCFRPDKHVNVFSFGEKFVNFSADITNRAQNCPK